MKFCKLFCVLTLVATSSLFVGCESEEDPYVSPSGQEVAPDVVVNTPSDAVTLNLLIDDELASYYSLTDAFNWDSDNSYNSTRHKYEGVEYDLTRQRLICDLGAMNGLGNITTFSTPNPALECAIFKGHGYIFYNEISSDGISARDEDGYYSYTVEDEALRVAIINDYYRTHGGGFDYYCVWVEDVFANGITVKYVIRRQNVVTE